MKNQNFIMTRSESIHTIQFCVIEFREFSKFLDKSLFLIGKTFTNKTGYEEDQFKKWIAGKISKLLEF